jgi:hypothetical protein
MLSIHLRLGLPSDLFVKKALIFNINYIRTSQEHTLWASTACYRDSFTFLYVDGIHTLQETHL